MYKPDFTELGTVPQLEMGEVQSKLGDSNAVSGLSYLEDGQFAKIYKVTTYIQLNIYITQL